MASFRDRFHELAVVAEISSALVKNPFQGLDNKFYAYIKPLFRTGTFSYIGLSWLCESVFLQEAAALSVSVNVVTGT